MDSRMSQVLGASVRQATPESAARATEGGLTVPTPMDSPDLSRALPAALRETASPQGGDTP